MATRKITIEEAVTTDEFQHFDEAFIPSVKDEMGEFLQTRLHVKNFERRLKDMDDEGIDIQILSLTSPGVQSIDDPEHAAKSARQTNEFGKAGESSHGRASGPHVRGDPQRCAARERDQNEFVI